MYSPVTTRRPYLTADIVVLCHLEPSCHLFCSVPCVLSIEIVVQTHEWIFLLVVVFFDDFHLLLLLQKEASLIRSESYSFLWIER